MSRKRIYNRVMDDRSGVCPLGELLTDKELERMRLHNSRRDWPNTAKVTVKDPEVTRGRWQEIRYSGTKFNN